MIISKKSEFHSSEQQSKTILFEEESCRRCGRKKILTDPNSGEILCGACGYVMTEKIEDSGPEYRNFMDGEDRSRTGSRISLTRHDKGLATIIGPRNKDASGKSLTPAMKYSIERLRIWDNRSQAHKSSDRNFRQAFQELGKLKEKLGLSQNIIEKTAYVYRKAVEKGIIRGRSISALLAASLYAACRDAETPRTLKDVELASNIKRKELAKCYRMLVQTLDLKIPVMDSTQSISKIANQLKVTEKTKRLAISILKKYQDTGDSAGKSPTGLAATAVYLACVKTGEYFTQRKVAEAANVTEVTIRNRASAIKNALDLN